MKRETIIKDLKDYYNRENIVPGINFNCNKKDCCQVINNNNAVGMQCHVGTKYGENKYNVLVVSLDCGHGGASNIDERTKDVESSDFSNLHMKGTGKLIGDFYETSSTEALKYYAMTNSCKCSKKTSSNQQGYNLHSNCANHKLSEIDILQPDVIYFQGINSRAAIESKFQNIDNIPKELSSYIKYLEIGDKRYPAVLCVHPSARGRHRIVANHFYDVTIKEINKYIKEKILGQ